MKGNGRRDKTRRYIILTLYIVAVLFAVAAVVYEPNRAFYAAIAGYDMLFLVSYFVTSLAQNVPNSGKYMLLSFSVCLLFAVIIALLYLLFFSRMKEAKTEVTEVPPEEIRIPSAPQVMGTVWIMDDASPHLQDASESEATPTDTDEEPVLVIPADDAEDTTLLTDDSQIKAEDTAIPEDSTLPESADFIDIPDVPVFTEAIIKTEEITADVVLVPPETEKISEVPSTPAFTEAILTLDKTTATVSLITFPDKPFMLEPIMEIGEAKIPSAPSIIEPNAIISEEAAPAITPEPVKETSNDDFFSGLSPEEADFWADFYIAGEDELELADGIYYMDLYINEMYTGDITVLIKGGAAYLSAMELEKYLDGTVTDDMLLRLFHSDEEYISLEYIESQNVVCSYDSLAYEVYLQFSMEDMPVQILSLRGTPRSGISRTLAGATVLEPAVFTITSDYTLSTRVNDFRSANLGNQLSFYFTADNDIRLYDLNLELDYYLYFGLDWFTADVSRYVFHLEFEDILARLSWGNISTSLLSPAGQTLGIKFETDPMYGSPDARNSHSYVEQLIVVDKRSDVQIFNEGREIFRRTLSPGVYRLRDFILYTGANRIRIVIQPLDGSESQEIEMDVLYSSSILAPGEVYFNVALATGRERVVSRGNAPGEVYIPFGDYMLRYDARNLTLSSDIEAGLAESLGLSASLSVQNLPTDQTSFRLNTSLSLEFTHINKLGTTRYSFNVKELSDSFGYFELPSMNMSIGHQVATGWTPLSSLTLGASYIAPSEWNFKNYNPVSLNLSMSGRLGIFSWGLAAYGTVPVNAPDNFSWSVSGSFGLYTGPNFSISGSIGISDTASNPANITGRIAATYRFGIGSVTASASSDEASVSTYIRKDEHYFRADASSNGYSSINDLEVNASYSYSGNLFDVELSLNTASLFDKAGAAAVVSTSTIFTDGVFAMTSSIPSNYLLIRQYGSLKGNDLFIGSAGSSSTREVPTIFGTGVYSGVSSYDTTNIGLFSSGKNVFGGTSSYSLSIPYSQRNGYVLRLYGENVYAAAGEIVLPDGTPWLNGASPLYAVDDESSELESIDKYLFTDSDGMFTVNGLAPGKYAFDVPYGNSWLLYIFSVEDSELYSEIQMNEVSVFTQNDNTEGVYSYFVEMDNIGSLNENEFFNLIYPEEAV